MLICGQTFSPATLAHIRQWVESSPDLTRTALSRRVCELLEWRDPLGRLKDMQCRVALLKLHRRGVLSLPPACARPGPGSTAWQARDDGRIEGLELATVQGSLGALGPVWLSLVEGGQATQSRAWWTLMQVHHPLGGGPLCGAQLRYFIHSNAGCLGALSFSAPAWRLQARDAWIGWNDAHRQAGLARVINNSRFLILPGVHVPHLASHVLGLALRQVAGDWQAHYGITPVLAETFTDPAHYRGTCYRAANWQLVGSTRGRGRQDRRPMHERSAKEVWLYPLARNWRAVLGGREPPPVATPAAPATWAAVEFGGCALGDARLTRRLVELAEDFYAQPTGSIPQACGGDRSKTKAAYRLLSNPRVDMQTLLEPHYLATEARLGAHRLVLAVQDTTSLNYSSHPATQGMGPVGNSIEARGLQVHSTLTLTPDGTPLGFIDVQSWARNAEEFGKRRTSRQRPIGLKESNKWLHSLQICADVQQRQPGTTIVSVADREADIYELFAQAAGPDSPRLLVRAAQNRRVQSEQKLLWPTVMAQTPAGDEVIRVPRQGSRAARDAKLTVRHARVNLLEPGGKGSLPVWAVHACEEHAQEGASPLEWMLLTTLPVESLEQAVEKLRWYARRWTIEVLHRILKSGCRIEERQLDQASRLENCLALDLVVAWRILHLSKLGRETPELPCTVYFEEAEWKALVALVSKNPDPPEKPPTIREAMRLVGKLGGFLGRKSDGEPGAQSLWIGLQKLDSAAEMWTVMMRRINATHRPVSRRGSG